MGITLSIRKAVSLGGVNFSMSKSLEVDEGRSRQKTLTAAAAGQLTTRTDDDTGTFTMDSSGHGVATGDTIDIYWDDGTQIGCRRNVVVGTVAGTSVPFGAVTVGAGDVLPTNLTDVTVQVITDEVFVFTGTDAKVIVAMNGSAGRAQVRFFATATEELATTIEAGEMYIWHYQDNFTNPITGDSITKVRISHEDSAATAVISFGVGVTN